ncbi:MAG: hypothetical protein N2Z21_02165 [Candidatus Sumerlaeaceae bacterium]|nr:hypothetical protein [Candidatus Sumerlaeaceae bacterium]
MVLRNTPSRVDRLRKDTSVRWDRQLPHSTVTITWGNFVRFVALFGLGVLLAALHIVLSFYARELALERLAVQKSAEKCLKRIERLETEYRMLVESRELTEEGRRHFGLASIQPGQRRTVVMEASLVEKYQRPVDTRQIAMSGSSSEHGSVILERFLERSGIAGKVFASQPGMNLSGR